MTDRAELPATLTNLVSAHHRVRAGKGIRRVPGQMNRTEAAYGIRLDILKASGEVAEWWYEGITLKLAADCRYTPDFLVMLPDLSLEIHETKGFMREDALVKLRVAAACFPFRVRLVRLVRGSWLVRDFSPEMVPDAPAEAVRLAGSARARRRGAKTTTGAGTPATTSGEAMAGKGHQRPEMRRKVIG